MNLRPKLPFLDTFDWNLKKLLSHLKPTHLNLWEMQSFMLRRKIKLGTKTCVLLDWNLKKLLSYLKSGPANLLKCKVSCKNKKHFEFGTRNDLFCYFQVRIWKNWYHIWNYCSQIYQNAKFLKSLFSNLSKCKVFC